MASMLLNEEFVAVFPSLVRRLGSMNKAAVLQAIHFASQIQSKTIEGVRWTPMTASQIALKTGLSDDAAQRALTGLVEMGVLIGRGAAHGTRKLMWLIVHDQLELPREIAEPCTAKTRNDLRDSAESTTTKNKEEESKNIVWRDESANLVVKAFIDKFRALYRLEPDGNLVGRLARDAKRMLADGRPMDLLILSAESCAVNGHANLPASMTKLLTSKAYEPRGFTGIRQFLESDDQN